MTYRQHIDALAAELGVDVKYSDWRAVMRDSNAYGPDELGHWYVGLKHNCETLPEYTVALHELGHRATLPHPVPHQDECSEDFILEYETRAWQWAQEHATLGFDAHKAAAGLISYMVNRRQIGPGWDYAATYIRSLDLDWGRVESYYADALANAY